MAATALHQQRSEGYTARKIMDLFGMTLLTFKRWLAFFRLVFPQSSTWQRLRGLLIPPVEADAIPLGVLERLGLNRDGPETALVLCLRLLAGCGV